MDTSSSDESSEPDPTSGSVPFPLATGTLVNGIYRLVRQVGAGGMGQVWEARHERTKGRVALKVLLPEMGRHEEVLRRFQREVEVTSALNHPNIVRVTDAGELPDGRPYLVMEFLEGHDMTTVAGRALPLGDVIDIVEQTAMGLHVAHGQSVIHRDLKPANIFIVPLPGTSRSLVKVLDFGISKAMDGVNQLTHTRNVIGTPYYMAPEQATGGRSAMDARADQFSLAAIAYELVTGQMAFEGDGVMNVIYKVVNDPPRSFASLGVAAPAGVEAAILRALSKSPNDRFPSVMEFAEALKQPGAVVLAPDSRPAAITAQMRAVPGTLILPGPTFTTTLHDPTTLRDSVGELAGAEEILPAPGAAPPSTTRALGRRSIVAIVSGGVIAAGVASILIVRGGDAEPATHNASAISAAAPPPAPAPAAPAPLKIQPPPSPPKEPELAAPPAKAEPAPDIVLPQQPRHPAVVEPTRSPGPRKPAPKKPSLRTGPLNEEL